MTQEDKNLLLIDLSARLFHGVKGIITYNKSNITFTVEGIDNNVLHLSDAEECYVEDFKPYLRSLSSMTKDEVKEFQSISNFKCYPKHIRGAFFDNDYTPFSTFDSASKFCKITTSNVISCIDWLLKNHFDFRGLIKKDLALEAPEGMYDLKKE